jgi:hypothetical protein
MGHSRRFERALATSAFHPIADIPLLGAFDALGRFCSLIPGLGVKLPGILAGPTGLSAVGTCSPHDGVRRRWWINVESAIALSGARKKSDDLTTAPSRQGRLFPPCRGNPVVSPYARYAAATNPASPRLSLAPSSSTPLPPRQSSPPTTRRQPPRLRLQLRRRTSRRFQSYGKTASRGRQQWQSYIM